MDFHGFKWLISFCACSFQISIIMFIFLYRLTGGDDHADQRGKACLKCFCDTFDSDRCMNSLTRGWMSMVKLTCHYRWIMWDLKALKPINFVSSCISFHSFTMSRVHFHVLHLVLSLTSFFFFFNISVLPLSHYISTFPFLLLIFSFTLLILSLFFSSPLLLFCILFSFQHFSLFSSIRF